MIEENVDRREIKMPGDHTLNLGLLANEREVARLEGGIRDVGILGWILGHRITLVLTNQRVVEATKKTRDYSYQVMAIKKIDHLVTGSYYKIKNVVLGLFWLYLSIQTLIFSEGEGASYALFFGILGIVFLLFAKTKAFIFSNAGGSIKFAISKATEEEFRSCVSDICGLMSVD